MACRETVVLPVTCPADLPSLAGAFLTFGDAKDTDGDTFAFPIAPLSFCVENREFVILAVATGAMW